MKKLTRIGFYNWLTEQPPDTIVGRTSLPCSCPIANFIGGYVSSTHYANDLFLFNKKAKSLPVWARSFIMIIDDRGRNERAVSAQEALNVLSSVTARKT